MSKSFTNFVQIKKKLYIKHLFLHKIKESFNSVLKCFEDFSISGLHVVIDDYMRNKHTFFKYIGILAKTIGHRSETQLLTI